MALTTKTAGATVAGSPAPAPAADGTKRYFEALSDILIAGAHVATGTTFALDRDDRAIADILSSRRGREVPPPGA